MQIPYRLFRVCICVRREEQAVVIYQNVKRILTESLSRGCYRNWTLASERESIITEWKLHFVFGTEQNGNWLLDLKSLAAGVSRWCIGFSISRSFIGTYEMSGFAVLEGCSDWSEQKKTARNSRDSWVACEMRATVGAGIWFPVKQHNVERNLNPLVLYTHCRACTE